MRMGLTGGIASGKSTVSAMLAKRGAIIIDADQLAREVVLPGSPALAQVFERFGQAVRKDDGSLNRKRLGEMIFNDASARKDLESILHPPIRALMRERMDRIEREQPGALIVADIPLLFESGLQEMFEQVMLVYVPEAIQIKRLISREGLTEEQANLRIKAQMSIEEKIKLADIVIDNSGTLEESELQIEEFWQRKDRA